MYKKVLCGDCMKNTDINKWIDSFYLYKNEKTLSDYSENIPLDDRYIDCFLSSYTITSIYSDVEDFCQYKYNPESDDKFCDSIDNSISSECVLRQKMYSFLDDKYPNYKGSLSIYDDRVFREVENYIEIIGIFEIQDDGSFIFLETHEREDEHLENPLEKYKNNVVMLDNTKEVSSASIPMWHMIMSHKKVNQNIDENILSELSMIYALKIITNHKITQLVSQFSDLTLDYILKLSHNGYVTFDYNYKLLTKDELELLTNKLKLKFPVEKKKTKNSICIFISEQTDNMAPFLPLISIQPDAINIKLSEQGNDWYHRNSIMTSDLVSSNLKEQLICLHKYGETYYDTMMKYVQSKYFFYSHQYKFSHQLNEIREIFFHERYKYNSYEDYCGLIVIDFLKSFNGICYRKDLFDIKKMFISKKYTKGKNDSQISSIIKNVFEENVSSYYFHDINKHIRLVSQIDPKIVPTIMSNIRSYNLPINLCNFDFLEIIINDIIHKKGIKQKLKKHVYQNYNKLLNELIDEWS